MDFDSSLTLEDGYYAAGHEEGTRVGHEQGLIEGRIYGSEVSYERFMALGLLYGRVSVWKAKYAAQPRIMRHIEKVEEALRKVPRDNGETAENEDFETMMGIAIGKMKVVASLAGEDTLIKQGLIQEGSIAKADGDLEDGAEFAVRLRGGKRGCGT